MHLLFLLVTVAQAAEPPFCSQDLSDYPPPLAGGFAPKHMRERAVQPGLLRLQEDMCRCLPGLPRNWPSLVKAYLHVDPNGGEMNIEYIIRPQGSRRVSRMYKCMGEPTLTFEPMEYKSDIVYPDGREEVFPAYPVVVDLEDVRARKVRSQRRK